MKRQNKLYLRILIIAQIIICFVMSIFLLILSKKISSHNNEIIRMSVISDAEKRMKEAIDNTIKRIEFKRELAQEQVNSLVNMIKNQVKGTLNSDIEKIISSIYEELKKNIYGSAIEIYAIDISSGKISMDKEGKLQNKFLKSEEIDELKSKSAIFESMDKGEFKVIIYSKQSDIDNSVKKQVHEEINDAIYQNNEYIWVNEILNYDGGEQYASRVIHPNLAESEGELLSTETQDIKGNYPYLKELEGIKEKGEILQTYYFKNKEDDEISQKLSYGKLYKPFNWVIVTGQPLDDILMYSNKLQEYDKSVVYSTLGVFLVLTVIIFIFSVGIIIKWQKHFISYIDKYIELETEVDPLSGALTRKAADKYLESKMKNTLYRDIPQLVLMIDIDNFKKINDTYGHDNGDVVLRKVSQTILSCIRSTDKLFRWGGEEFLLICQGVKYDEQNIFAERILSNVNSIIFEVNKQKFRVSVSIGGAYVSKKMNDMVYSGVIKRADNALYRAKNTGKNKYCCDDIIEE